jgi:hypothetical protein
MNNALKKVQRARDKAKADRDKQWGLDRIASRKRAAIARLAEVAKRNKEAQEEEDARSKLLRDRKRLKDVAHAVVSSISL